MHISWKSPIYFLHYGKATAPPALCIHSVISLAWLGTLNKNKFAVYSGDSASVFIVMRLRELLFISYLGCLAFYFKQISTTEHLLIEFQPLQFKLNNFIAIIIRSQLFFSIFTHVTTFLFCPRLRAESHHTSDVGPRSSVRDHIPGVERGERRGEPRELEDSASASGQGNTVSGQRRQSSKLGVTSLLFGILTG